MGLGGGQRVDAQSLLAGDGRSGHWVKGTEWAGFPGTRDPWVIGSLRSVPGVPCPLPPPPTTPNSRVHRGQQSREDSWGIFSKRRM